MAFSVLTNIAGIQAQNALALNQVNLNQTLQRLSTGQRINSGADDPAGLGIASSLQANVQAINQAVANANDGVSVAQIADGALSQISNLLTQGFSLAEEAATDTVDSTGRAALDNELTSIKSEITRIATQTDYNGLQLFSTGTANSLNGTLHVYVGDTSQPGSIAVNIASITTTSGWDQTLQGASLTTAAGATTAITTLQTALEGVSSSRADIGAGINRLQSAVAVLQTQSQNTQAAESNIMDADMAQEIANLTKYQILAQTGIAALSQANASAQNVLTLLKG
jgi:flagellin